MTHRPAHHLRMGLALGLVVLLGALAVPGWTQTSPDPSIVGQWDGPFTWPLVAVHMALQPTGDVLVWDGQALGAGSQRLWRPATGEFVAVPSSANLYGAGAAALGDGRLLVAGGYISPNVGIAETNLFDSATRTWTAAHAMVFPRWYPGTTTLPDGRVLVTTGATSCATCLATVPEVYDPSTNLWTSLSNASVTLPLYPFVSVLPDGRVLSAGASQAPDITRVLDVAAQTWITVDPVAVDGGTAVMYEPGKVMKSGTAAQGDATSRPAQATTYVLDMSQPAPRWASTAAMAFPRAYHNMTLLPDGTVLVIGGGRTTAPADLANAVLPAEIWSPVTQTWSTKAAMQTPRLYQSTAILLPDGRVLVAGGGRFAGGDQLSAEIYSPPYLFRGARPTITSTPAALHYGRTSLVATPDAAGITSVALIRLGSTTHSFDQDQRFLHLTFQTATGGLDVTSPSAAQAPPGHYMLFLVNGNGVPSVAAMVIVGSDTDNDGLTDAWEQRHFGNLSHSGSEDADGDGLTNAQELAAGTDPTRADTDGDGFSDAVEIAAGSNPLDPASTPPAVALAPSSLAFGTGAGSPSSQTVTVTNSGPGALGWTATADKSWLSVTPASGTTPGSFTVSIAPAGLASGTYSGTITVASAQAVNSPQHLPVTLTVSPSVQTVNFTYADRTALLATGWDFLARSATGTPRDTEQRSGLVVSYDQTAHPGVIRIPADVGTFWALGNNTRNTLFRDIPTNWESLRLDVAAFAPTAPYQGACLVAYQDDDNYVTVCRDAVPGQIVEWWHESAASATGLGNVAATATTSVILRLDRDPATETLTASFSIDGGANWTRLPGSVVKALANPRIGVAVGGNTSTTSFPAADIAWVQVVTGAPLPPAIGLSPSSLGFSGGQGAPDPAAQSLTVKNAGGGTLSWTASTDRSWLRVSPTSGVAPTSISVTASITGLAAGTYSGTVTVSSADATNSPQTVAVSLTVAEDVPSSFTYSSRSALIADGWDFLARTAAGGTRNTEQPTGRVVDYDQTAHPGVIRIPADAGTFWGTNNDTRNTLFHDLPANWATVRLTVAAFAPTVQYQGACLAAYQDDDNYAIVCRDATPSQLVEWWHERAASAGVLGSAAATATTNVVLRLDRDAATETLTAYVSVNGGGTWTQLPGSIAKALTKPRLGIVVGGNTSTTSFPAADIASVEIMTGPPLPPSLQLTPASLTFSSIRGTNPVSQTFTVSNPGGGTASWAATTDQPWLTVSPTTGTATWWTPASATVSVSTAGLAAGTYSGTVTVSSSQATNSPQSVTVSLTVKDGVHIDFTYPDRTALLVNGWDFLARRTSGAIRDTEQTSGLVVSYDQTAHPGVIRIPADTGTFWALNNNTRNTLFRDLPTNWESLRLEIASFAPTAPYQGACLIAYQDDDNYATVCRDAIPGQIVEWWHEGGASPAPLGSIPATATANVLLRLDRDPATHTITAFASLDGGATWTFLPGSIVKSLANPRVGVAVGGNGSTTSFPAADLAWVEIVTGTAFPPTFNDSPGSFSFSGISGGAAPAAQTLTIGNTGGGTLGWTASVDQPWLGVTPATDTAPGSVTVTASTTGLAAGTYTGTITLSSAQATNTPQRIPVSLSVISLSDARILGAAVLVNSANTAGYNRNPLSPGEFQRYPERYLEHLQVPYDVIDVATTAPPPNLFDRQLIIAGHSGLNLSTGWRNAIADAVNLGTGFINLDWSPQIGFQSHIQTIFGATGSAAGSPGTSITVPATVQAGGTAPHFIAALQRPFPAGPVSDIIYDFHPDASGVFHSVQSTVLTGAGGVTIARVGNDAFLVATAYGAGRAVHVGTLEYLRADRFGFLYGLDDLFWRSLVWAARKPFALRGYPRFWALRIDDQASDWMTRVRDLYDPTLTGSVQSDGTGGPWKVTGYVIADNVPPGSAERAAAIADIDAGSLAVSPHALSQVDGGDLYWNTTTGPLSDAQWLARLDGERAWQQGAGGADTIPRLSRTFIPHWWNLSNNIGADAWDTLGFRYVTTTLKPGFGLGKTPDGSDRLNARPFWLYEKPPRRSFSGDEDQPLFFADDYTIGSRAGLAPRTFFLFETQVHALGDPRFDVTWPTSGNPGAGFTWTVQQSVTQFERYTWRLWSSQAPVEIYTHDLANLQNSSVADRRSVIGQVSTWLTGAKVRHTFMEDLSRYARARTKSVLAGAHLRDGQVTYTFTGDAATADGAPVTTELRLFLGDDDGAVITVPGFSGGAVVTLPVPAP